MKHIWEDEKVWLLLSLAMSIYLWNGSTSEEEDDYAKKAGWGEEIR